ncbi:MAG: sugar phosphate isomerase/epimerase [Planctomycetales bacterium]|nr:sugar phosphate isomerase/epimerase [Planctomycetales bacterium]
MPILSMNELTTYRWTFDQDVRRYQQAGYKGIGVWRQKLADFGEERGIDLLAESGLKVTNLLWAGGFTGSAGRSSDESLRDAAHAIRLAGAMGAGCLVVYPGGRNNHTQRHADRLLHGAMEEMLDLAVASDVTLAVEPMHPACCQDWTFLSSLEAARGLVDRFRTPHLKLVLDAYHFGDDPTLLANLSEWLPLIGIVHLGDRKTRRSIDLDRCPLGEGRVPLDALVQGLLEAGYQGDFDVELLGSEIELADYEQLLQSSLELFDRWLQPLEKSLPTPDSLDRSRDKPWVES